RLRIGKVIESLRRMRYFRRQYDPRRAYFYRQYLGQRDTRYYPDNLTPRANTFVPYAHSNVEQITARVLDAFFAIDPPIETRGLTPRDEASAPAMQAVLLSMLGRAKWIQAVELLVRNICIYGHAGIKIDWDWDYDEVTAPEPIYAMQPMQDQVTGLPILNPDGSPAMMPLPNPMTGEPIQLGTRVITKRIPRSRPLLVPIDVFDLLIDPDGRQIAHLMEVPFSKLKRQNEANPSLFLPGAIDELAQKVALEKDPDNILIRVAELWNESDNTVSLMTFGEDAEAVSWKDLRYSYRQANYSSYKLKVYGGSPILLQHRPNPFIHKRAPILHTSYVKLTGEPYGIGVIETISDLNESLNKFCNMITDNWNMGINKRYAYDVNADIDHKALSQFNVPGGKVGVSGNPQEVIFPLPTMTPTPAEFSILELYREQIEQVSGMSDLQRGAGGGHGGVGRSATGISQVINEGNFIFKMFIRNLEVDILQPMMKMCASMVQQFISQYAEYQITDAPPGIPKAGQVPIENLIGNYDFDFVAANYATNKVVRQRNMMAYYQIAMQSPYCNEGEFIREIGKTMEIPNVNRLIKGEQQVQMEQAQAMQSQQQAVLLEKILDTESKMLVAEVAKKDPNTVTAHARNVQDTVEDMLLAAGDLVAPPASAKAREGRPATNQPGGALPGGTQMTGARSAGQKMGANGMGIAGMGE
ncbi:MAG: hypothetical protein LAO23_24140, partial [Acidobacteriia bacterium]|nr:hypothetical protein [Terriglobia bacterium]